MAETLTLKALAQRFLSRDDQRDSGGDYRLTAAPEPASTVSQPRMLDEDTRVPGAFVHGQMLRDLVPAYRVYSRVLGEEVWLVEDDTHANELESELSTGGNSRLIFTVPEVEALRGMLDADIRKLADVKRWLPGSRIETAGRRADGQAT